MLISPVTIKTEERFLLFGMGPNRRKHLYQNGRLYDVRTRTIVREWNDIVTEQYEPWEYRVQFRCADGNTVQMYENEVGFWIHESVTEKDLCLSEATIPALPRFADYPQEKLLRVLHHELLTNIAEAEHGGAPLPNLFVYDKPWFRDAAMVALCLERTGNLSLLATWGKQLETLEDPFDRNNAGHREPDNLGQLLTVIALLGGDATHPLVASILTAAEEFRKDDYLNGFSDFAEHPVYQTKWLKYGLRRLGLDDSRWTIPPVKDSYSALFWMDFCDSHVPQPGFNEKDKALYPYLGWAEAHFQQQLPNPLPSADDFPLTWEVEASQANYDRLALWGDSFVTGRICTPHTWHAAEIFLYLLDISRKV